MNKAVLVGINKYPGCPLEGCVNDVSDMAQFLVSKCGFAPGDIKLVTDAQATTIQILNELNWLVNSQPGDRVLFHYSGHGALVPNNGEVFEVVCPIDFDWSMERMITDKQFVSTFAKMPAGVKFNWLSDSCHSGDLDRDMLAPHSKWKLYPVPPHILQMQKDARDMGLKVMVGRQLDVGYAGACQVNQTAADASFGNRPNGAFTYFFLQSINSMLNAPLAQVIASVKGALQQSDYEQIPFVDGVRMNIAFLG